MFCSLSQFCKFRKFGNLVKKTATPQSASIAIRQKHHQALRDEPAGEEKEEHLLKRQRAKEDAEDLFRIEKPDARVDRHGIDHAEKRAADQGGHEDGPQIPPEGPVGEDPLDRKDGRRPAHEERRYLSGEIEGEQEPHAAPSLNGSSRSRA